MNKIEIDLNFPIMDAFGKEVEKASETVAKNLKGESDPKHDRSKFNEIADELNGNGILRVSYSDWRTINDWWKKLQMPAFAFAPIAKALQDGKDEHARKEKESKA